jgi:magnesium-transporting ATPase (P-type)
MELSELIPILQVAIGPVILISGVGLVLLSMTNRYGRVIDRVRALSDSLRSGPSSERGRLSSQLDILARRARLIRLSISLSVLSVLLAALLIIALFLAALMRWEIGVLVALLFIACMGSLIASLLVFLVDINVSLSALKLEMSHASRD